ncbi:MAG TPA: UMP kinase [Thermoplasmata archaeon]|nr:UMP kinase [Thermoplasmata archaeon]
MEGAGSGASPAVVVSVGGSVLLKDDDDARFLGDLADLLRRLGRSTPLVVTTGGGRTAREYIRLGAALGLTDVELDELGIDVTRLHARLLAGRIGLPTASHPPTGVREAVEAVRHASPVVLGGTEPGHTTDAVAALIAVRLRAARVVNATDVDGLYDADPKTHPGARRVERVGWSALLDLLRRSTAGEPGQNFPFDRLGAEALARASIPLAIVAGRDLTNLGRAIAGEAFVGTIVGGPGGGPR